MKKQTTLITLTLLAAIPANAATYTWLGTAGDGDWNNATNWDANGVPVDNSTSTQINTGTAAAPVLEDVNYFNGLNMDWRDSKIVFSGTAPTTNIPSFGGTNYKTLDGDLLSTGARQPNSTPVIELHSGGTYNLTAGSEGNLKGIVVNNITSNLNMFTIGDGIGGAGDVTLNLALTNSLNREAKNHALVYTVNADGIFNINNNDSVFHMTYNDDRHTNLILNGGIFTVDAAVDISENSVAAASTFVDFTAAGSSFTAEYGGDFTNATDVQNAMGTNSFFRSSNGQSLLFQDNSGTGFTITSAAVPEPSSAALLGLAGMSMILRRRR